jgi:hypothetical protein
MAREGGLVAWQWRGYERNHRDRANLLLHIVLVPAFIAGILATVRFLTWGRWFAALFALAAFALQGLGHRREGEAPEPFLGPSDFVGRMFVEQFITFPRFVLSGQWARNFFRG